MKNARIKYAPTSFAVAVSKSRRELLHMLANSTPATITTKTGGISKKKEKAKVTFCKSGWVWEENAYIISQCLILYPNISGRTRRIRNKIRPVHFIFHDNTGEDFVNTSTESVSSGNRTDCREVYFSFFSGWYISGMTEAFCESCSM